MLGEIRRHEGLRAKVERDRVILRRCARRLPAEFFVPPAEAEDPNVGVEILEEPFEGPVPIPTSRWEVYETFGDPGPVKLDRRWERRNMVLARNLPIARGRLYCHRLAEPFIREALRRASLLLPGYVAAAKVGCFAYRHQRHDPRRPLSYHAWGIAIDVDPASNRARYLRAGKRPEPWSEGWTALWPSGIPELVVRAFESVGFSWGGRWRRFVDPMHFELVART